MSLSFKITRRFVSIAPALFKASNAKPPLIELSPIIAVTCLSLFSSSAATAMPNAALIEVLECAVPKASYSLSSRRGNPAMPPCMRNFSMPLRLPVRILWTYVW